MPPEHDPCQQIEIIGRMDERIKRNKNDIITKAKELKGDIDNIGKKCGEHHKMAHDQENKATAAEGRVASLEDKADKAENQATQINTLEGQTKQAEKDIEEIGDEIEKLKASIENLPQKISAFKQYGPTGGVAGLWAIYEILRSLRII